MRILHCTDLHGISTWRAWIDAKASEFDAVCITGDSLPQIGLRVGQNKVLKHWLEGIKYPLYYSRGGHDLHAVEKGGPMPIKNPRVAAADGHMHGGWKLHVLDAYGANEMPSDSRLPTIIVSHFGPAGSLCAKYRGEKGERGGRTDVRSVCEYVDGIKLVLCGNIHDPVSHMDEINGVTICNPGVAWNENAGYPAHAIIDLADGMITLDTTRRRITHAFQV